MYDGKYNLYHDKAKEYIHIWKVLCPSDRNGSEIGKVWLNIYGNYCIFTCTNKYSDEWRICTNVILCFLLWNIIFGEKMMWKIDGSVDLFLSDSYKRLLVVGNGLESLQRDDY